MPRTRGRSTGAGEATPTRACSVPVGVVGREGVQVAHLAEAALDVCHVDLHVVLEAAAGETHDYLPRSAMLGQELWGKEGLSLH